MTQSNLTASFLEFIQWREVFVMMIVGAAFITPTLLLFYYFLEKCEDSRIKLIIDQFLFSPVFNAAIIAFRFFLIDSSLSATDIGNLVLKIAPSAIKTAWLFWIPQRYFTLNYVPPTYQIVFGNMCGFVWNIIFSMLMAS